MKATFTTTTGKTFTAYWNGKVYGVTQTAYLNISDATSGNPRGKVTFQMAGDRRFDWSGPWLCAEDCHAALAALRLQGFDPIAEEPVIEAAPAEPERRLCGEAAMQAKMRDIFAEAGKHLRFEKVGFLWRIFVDGKLLGEQRKEAEAFQEALDASGIGGEISYTYDGSVWTFAYTPTFVQQAGRAMRGAALDIIQEEI